VRNEKLFESREPHVAHFRSAANQLICLLIRNQLDGGINNKVRRQKDRVNIILATDELDTSGCRASKLRFFNKSSISIALGVVGKYYVIDPLLSLLRVISINATLSTKSRINQNSTIIHSLNINSHVDKFFYTPLCFQLWYPSNTFCFSDVSVLAALI